MKTLIIGAGIVGVNLAEMLSKEGHDVTIIDKDADRIKDISETLDIMTIVGQGTNISTLKEAGIESAEMVIAVTNIDEVNILSCMIASHFGPKTRVARVRNEELSSFALTKDKYVDRFVNPDGMIIKQITKILKIPSATYVSEFVNGELLFCGFNVPPDAQVIGKKLSELSEISETDVFLIVGISRNNQIFVPHGNDDIKEGDDIYVVVAKDTLSLFLPLLNRRVWDVERVIIYDASDITLKLAKQLEDNIKEVIILEPNEEKAERASALLDKAVVIKGKGTNVDILKEAEIHSADFFIAISENDEENLTASLVARKYGAKRNIVLTNNPDYVQVLDSIEMDVVINPRLITVSAILEYIRRGRIRTVIKVKDFGAEVLEMEALPKSPIIGRPLNQLSLPAGMIIGAVVKNDFPIIPKGDTIIIPGDKVVVFALPDAIKKIEGLFTSR
ncbi:MAG: Trk system potassium transporter TrkA [Planctomycetota bacterium]|nr:Trk system potassium transporter TrkA [Planctomycetota bacterium]MDI6787969.1 Trk system potassium transporter TrkA [Planctomycetota bacterium]